MSQTANPYPMLSERSRGWLKYLHRKINTPDNWDRDGHPSPMWDDQSSPPFRAFSRMDLLDTTCAVALMADVTPAWREGYASLIDQMCQRHTTYWAAIDWLTQIGHDPQRGNYPDEWKIFIPPKLLGQYDAPGWTANGIEPWGLQLDPIGADGNLFFRGFFNLMLGLYRYVSGDNKWNRPFDVTGGEGNSYTYTHSRINHVLTRGWAARREGPHCENTKVWSYCLLGAGLGLRLHDLLYQSKTHWVYDRWWKYAKENYVLFSEDGLLKRYYYYYDPIIDHLHEAPVSRAAGLVYYLAPQNFDDAQRIYESSAPTASQLNDPAARRALIKEARWFAMCILNAREMGDTARYEAMHALAEELCEPTWDRARGEFYYRFGLSNYPQHIKDARAKLSPRIPQDCCPEPNPHPLGQTNAFIMAAEVGSKQAWWRIFNQPNLRKFDQPTVCDVDFPRLGISQAIYDEDKDVLAVSTYAADPWSAGNVTSFTVDHLREPARVRVLRDGNVFEGWRVSGEDRIEIKAQIQDHSYLVVRE